MGRITVGLIGCGNMGEALLKGITAAGGKEADVFVSRKDRSRLSEVALKYHVHEADNETAAGCDVVLLAVKPQQYSALIPQIAGAVRKDALFVYLAPGFSPERICEMTGIPGLHVIHLMPNTPCRIGEGVLAYSCGAQVTGEDEAVLRALLGSLGLVLKVEESQMSAVVGLSGSSPAYFYMMLDALACAGVRAGLKRKDALEMAAHTMKGSAMLALKAEHPCQLRDAVCSPGGTTIEAVYTLEKGGFGGLVMEAVQKCIDQSVEMSGKGKA